MTDTDSIQLGTLTQESSTEVSVDSQTEVVDTTADTAGPSHNDSNDEPFLEEVNRLCQLLLDSMKVCVSQMRMCCLRVC
jgi:hypothetical protein